jgi:pimeloyl-ACP methyl ester carboxylesterase
MTLLSAYKNIRLPIATYFGDRLGRCVALIFACFFLLTNPGQCKQVNLKEAVQINGIKQWLSIKGSSEKPILLFLHGGPGNSVMGYADKFTNKLAENFLIVLWDQRESGQTIHLNHSPVPLSVKLFVSDGVEVIQHLTKRFQKKKIFLMGHSWGGFLALRLAQEVPDLIEACVAMSPMVDQIRSEQMALEWMKQQAVAGSNTTAIDELAKVKIPFETTEDLFLHRKWLALLGHRKPPDHDFVEAWSITWLYLFMEASRMNLFQVAPSYRCAVYFFVGRNDYQTNFKVTEEYFNAIEAPQKKLIWFEKSAHSPNMTETKKFQQVTLEILSSLSSSSHR